MRLRQRTVQRGSRKVRVLAVSSAGGHWVQLNRLLPALDGCEVVVAAVGTAPVVGVHLERRYRILDATRWNRVRLVFLALHLFWILVHERPDCVLSTGAAPGYFALRFGKLFRARTIWVDSIANIDKLSMTAERVRPYADLWLTQWEHLARANGPAYMGKVL